MRRLAILAALVLLAPGALAGHATYVDESRVIGCLLRVQVTGIGAQLNCPGIARTAAAAESAGSYKLTVTWTPADALWANLEARLISCDGACNAVVGGIGACVNNICAGNGGGAGPVIVQEAAGISGSPLVLTIPTAGPETNVSFAFNAAGPVFASISSQSVHFTLAHV